MCVHNDSFNLSPPSGQALAERIMDTVDTLRMEPLDLKRFVLQADHPYLLQQLRQLKVVKQDAQISLSTGWPKLHEQLFKNQGLTWKDLQPPPELESNAWYLSLCRAKKEVLNYHLMRGKGNERGMWTTIDLSQSITRSPRGCGSYLRLIAWSHGPVFGASECVFPERSVQGVFGLKLWFPLLGCARALARLRVGVLLRFGGLCQTYAHNVHLDLQHPDGQRPRGDAAGDSPWPHHAGRGGHGAAGLSRIVDSGLRRAAREGEQHVALGLGRERVLVVSVRRRLPLDARRSAADRRAPRRHAHGDMPALRAASHGRARSAPGRPVQVWPVARSR